LPRQDRRKGDLPSQWNVVEFWETILEIFSQPAEIARIINSHLVAWAI
jgi:hypothetical protein